MMANATSTRDDLLSRVGDIFYAKGTYLVGMSELVDHLKTTRATFYRYFGSKEALIVAYLQKRNEAVSQQLHGIAGGRTGTEPVLDVFSNLERKTEAESFRGCAFLIAAIENPQSPEILNAARDHKLFLKDFFVQALGQETDDATAEQLLLLYEGALAGSVLRRDARSATTAKAIVAKLLTAPAKN